MMARAAYATLVQAAALTTVREGRPIQGLAVPAMRCLVGRNILVLVVLRTVAQGDHFTEDQAVRRMMGLGALPTRVQAGLARPDRERAMLFGSRRWEPVP
ncbi:MAG: hypothetical protein GY731_17050 [Gammaproteobacteria bacterium]|nr:hypothetical protein [Gammaproteobacteria bacterium]